jgi:hypothetical protein
MSGGPVVGKIMHDGVDSIRTYPSSANSDHTNSADASWRSHSMIS